MNYPKPVLYVQAHDPLPPACHEAIIIFDRVNCDYELKRVPIYDGMAVQYGLPFLYGLSGKFTGVQGVGIFIENATFLHVLPIRSAAATA